jgi:predicted esterase
MPSRHALLMLLSTAMAVGLFTTTASANAEEEKTAAPTVAVAFQAKRPNPNPWCASELESLASEVCYIDGRRDGSRKTLVIWLHGVIPPGTNWSHNHQRMLTRIAKATNIEMLFPRGELGTSLYGWPGTAAAQEKSEQELSDQWMTAKRELEKRDGRRFDEVFVFGFSSGAYFASSLAMRGRLDVDGYATFAGGQAQPVAPTPVEHFAPVFVGVCANDSTTASHSRAFAGSLAAAGIPRLVNEQPVGHDLSGAHFIQALGFLRAKMKPRDLT